MMTQSLPRKGVSIKNLIEIEIEKNLKNRTKNNQI